MALIIIDGLTNDESQFFDNMANYGHHIRKSFKINQKNKYEYVAIMF